MTDNERIEEARLLLATAEESLAAARKSGREIDFWKRARNMAAEHVTHTEHIQQASAGNTAADPRRGGRQSIITISEGGQWRTVLRAPADSLAARALFAFLAENLRPGLVVELDNGVAQMTLPSGEKIPAGHYAAVMGLTYE